MKSGQFINIISEAPVLLLAITKFNKSPLKDLPMINNGNCFCEA